MKWLIPTMKARKIATSRHRPILTTVLSRNEQARLRRQADPERFRAISRRSQARSYATNPDKHKKRSKAWYQGNKERAAAYHKAYRAKHREKKRAYFRVYYIRHAENLKARAKELGPAWVAKNPDKVCARSNRHRAAKIRAIPAWADHLAIAAVYRVCAATSRSTGIPHHVDHIVPLQSKAVCGLHVADNLQIIVGRENQSKGARYWPDMPIAA